MSEFCEQSREAVRPEVGVSASQAPVLTVQKQKHLRLIHSTYLTQERVSLEQTGKQTHWPSLEAVSKSLGELVRVRAHREDSHRRLAGPPRTGCPEPQKGSGLLKAWPSCPRPQKLWWRAQGIGRFSLSPALSLSRLQRAQTLAPSPTERSFKTIPDPVRCHQRLC